MKLVRGHLVPGVEQAAGYSKAEAHCESHRGHRHETQNCRASLHGRHAATNGFDFDLIEFLHIIKVTLKYRIIAAIKFYSIEC